MVERDPGRDAHGLLEREEALARVDRMLADALAGIGVAGVVEGEAGIGKTRLLGEARRRAREMGMEVSAARATELERDYAFGAVRQLFEPVLARGDAAMRTAWFEGAAALAGGVLPGFAPAGPVDGADRDYGLLHGLYWLLANLAADRPQLVVIDDAQWADEASLRFLAHLLPRVDALPVAVLVAMRPWTAGEGGPALARLAEDRALDRVELAALSVDAVLVRARQALGEGATPGFARACREATGGNPFYIRELLAELADRGVEPTDEQATAVPSVGSRRISRSIQARLAPLTPETTALVQAVAVLGDGTPLARAAALARLTPREAADAADALARAMILVPSGDLAFVHPIVRAAVEASLAPNLASAEHRRAAALLREEGGPPDRIATHLLATTGSGDVAVVELLRKAAADAVDRGSPEAAVTYLARALAEPPAHEHRGRVLQELGEAELRTGRLSSAAHLRESLLLLTDPRRRTDAARRLAAGLAFAHRMEDAMDVLIAEIERIGEDDRELRLLLSADLAMAGASLSSLPRAAAHLAELGTGLADRTPGERLAAAALALSRSGSIGQTAAEAAEQATRVLAGGRLLVEHPDSFIAFGATMNAAGTLIAADHLEDVEAFLAQALQHVRRRGSFAPYHGLMTMSSVVAFQRGDLRAAQADAETAVDAARLAEQAVLGVPQLAIVLVERDELTAADALFRDHGLTGPIGDTVFYNGLLLSRGELHLAQGRTEQALADFLEAERRLAAFGALRMEPPWRASLVLALARTGRRGEAVRRAAGLQDLADQWGTARAIGVALRTRGLLADDHAAADLLARSVAILDDSSARLELARSHAALGAHQRRRGERRDARKSLGRGLEGARECGATALERRIGEELAAAGGRVRRRPGGGIDALTGSELRITAMAADGLANREIAQALFVTTKTVEMHLGSAYRKLAIRSRHELAAALRRDTRGPSSSLGVGGPVRQLTTLVVTDIARPGEGSPAAGERRFRHLREAYRAAAQRELATFGGRRADTTLESTMATFDTPAQALRFARATRKTAHTLGLELRVGVHTGECEKTAGGLLGDAVRIAARVGSEAAAGEILVTNIVADIVAGSDLQFEERRDRVLHGVPGRWRLLALRDDQRG